MKIRTKNGAKRRAKKEWHIHFLWFPVKLYDENTGDTNIYWLEKVERRVGDGYKYYRRIIDRNMPPEHQR